MRNAMVPASKKTNKIMNVKTTKRRKKSRTGTRPVDITGSVLFTCPSGELIENIPQLFQINKIQDNINDADQEYGGF